MSDADFTVRNYDACSHGHDVRPRLLAGWQAVCWYVFESMRLIGMLLAMAGIWHMWKVLDTALELGDGAQKYATSKNLLRYAVVLVVFAVLMLTHFADPLAAFAGLMGMKASAYLQPFIRGYKEKKRR